PNSTRPFRRGGRARLPAAVRALGGDLFEAFAQGCAVAALGLELFLKALVQLIHGPRSGAQHGAREGERHAGRGRRRLDLPHRRSQRDSFPGTLSIAPHRSLRRLAPTTDRPKPTTDRSKPTTDRPKPTTDRYKPTPVSHRPM